MNGWDGKDRRRDPIRGDDHDLLTKIDANLSNFMRRFDDHTAEDSKSFDKLKTGQDRQNWLIAIGLGIIGAVEFFKDRIFK